MYFKKLLKKLCIFNIVTFMSCNLVPNKTLADYVNVPVAEETNTWVILDTSAVTKVSTVPDTYTGQPVTTSITIDKLLESGQTDAELTSKLTAAAEAFLTVTKQMQNMTQTNQTTQWQNAAKAYADAAKAVAKIDETVTNYATQARDYANSAVDNTTDAKNAAKAAAEAAVNAAVHLSATPLEHGYVILTARNAAAAGAARIATPDLRNALASYATSANNAAALALGDEIAAAYFLSTTRADGKSNDPYVGWQQTGDYDRVVKQTEAAVNAITKDFVDAINGAEARYELWVRLTAKTKNDDGTEITPTPPNASESTDWVKITNITENKNEEGNLTSITVSADMGKALMPGIYDVYVILTARETT